MLTGMANGITVQHGVSEDEDDHPETPQRPSAYRQMLQTPMSQHVPLATARRLSRTPGTP